MTTEEFRNLCEDISHEEANENWNASEVLRRIAGQIGTVTLDFNSDVAMHPELGELIA
jgi:hypothetical protein